MLNFMVVVCFNYAKEFGVFLQLIFIKSKYLCIILVRYCTWRKPLVKANRIC